MTIKDVRDLLRALDAAEAHINELESENSKLKAEVDRLRTIADKLRDARALAYSNGFAIGRAIAIKELKSKITEVLSQDL